MDKKSLKPVSVVQLAQKIRSCDMFSFTEKEALLRALRTENPRRHNFSGVKNPLVTVEEVNDHSESRIQLCRSQNTFTGPITTWKVHRELIEGMRIIMKEEYCRNTSQEKNSTSYGFYNRFGKLVIPPRYARVMDFSEGYCAVQDKKTGLWGFLQRNGVALTSLQWKSVGNFHEGKAYVQDPVSGKFGYIESNGKLDQPRYSFDTASSYKNGFATVTIQGIPYRRDQRGNTTIVE